MSEETPSVDEPQDVPAPQEPPEEPAPSAVPSPPAPASESLTMAQVEQAIEARMASVTDTVRDAVRSATEAMLPSAGVGGNPPAPAPKPKDPRSWLQRAWFGPRRW